MGHLKLGFGVGTVDAVDVEAVAGDVEYDVVGIADDAILPKQ